MCLIRIYKRFYLLNLRVCTHYPQATFGNIIYFAFVYGKNILCQTFLHFYFSNIFIYFLNKSTARRLSPLRAVRSMTPPVQYYTILVEDII